MDEAEKHLKAAGNWPLMTGIGHLGSVVDACKPTCTYTRSHLKKTAFNLNKSQVKSDIIQIEKKMSSFLQWHMLN